jgi:hypothetical protein
MERFFDGMDPKNSKTQGGKGQIKKIQKNKKERVEERKRRDFYVGGGSHTRVFSIDWEHPRLGEPTRMGTSPTPENTPPPMQMFSQLPKMPGPLGR